ncbi:MAG: MFS transporter [Planctomycetota bacterium]
MNHSPKPQEQINEGSKVHDNRAPHRAASPMSQAMVVAVLYGGLAFAGVSIAIFGCMLSVIQQDMALSEAQAGVCQALFFGGHLLGAIITGRLMGSWSTRGVWIMGLSATVGGSVLTGVPSLGILMLGRMLAGFGLASSVLFASGAIATMFPKRAGMMLNLMHAVIAAAAALTLMVGQPLGAALGSWTSVLWLTAIAAAVPLLLASMVPGTPRIESDAKAGFAVLRKVSVSPLLLPLIPAIIAYVAVEQAITVFMPQFIEGKFSVDAAYAANLTAMLWLGIIAGRVGSVLIGNRIHDGVQLAVGGLGMGVCMMMTLVVPEISMIPLLIFAAGVAGGPMVPLAFAVAAKRMPQAKNSAMTLCQMACCAGGIYGPLVAGTVGQHSSLSISLMFGFATIAVAVIPLIRSMPTQERQERIAARRALSAGEA